MVLAALFCDESVILMLIHAPHLLSDVSCLVWLFVRVCCLIGMSSCVLLGLGVDDLLLLGYVFL